MGSRQDNVGKIVDSRGAFHLLNFCPDCPVSAENLLFYRYILGFFALSGLFSLEISRSVAALKAVNGEAGAAFPGFMPCLFQARLKLT